MNALNGDCKVRNDNRKEQQEKTTKRNRDAKQSGSRDNDGLGAQRYCRKIFNAHMPQATSQKMVPTCKIRRTPVGLT